MFKYLKSNLNENKKYLDEYVDSLTSNYCNYLEDHILQSVIYSIYIEEQHCGYFGIFHDHLLTQFYITPKYFKYTQRIFKEVLDLYGIKHAYVPTGDERLMSLSLDQHKKVNLQAYDFEVNQDAHVDPPHFSRDYFHVATLDDLDEIKEITGDFTDRHEERIQKEQLYVLRENGEFLGLGILEDNVIMRNCKGTGMFTNPKHRQKGVGRSIIMHLKEICQSNNLIPLPGCWYYNHNSKKTLESAGYITKSRLLKIDF